MLASLRSRRRSTPRKAPVHLGWLLLVAVGALSGCSPSPPSEDRPPDVLLISIDTVRADAVSLVDDPMETVTTPSLAALARDGVVYENAFAPMAFTLPSHMTMLTGLSPVAHGVSRETHRLDPAIPTVVEEFRSAGYRTVGLFTNEWLAPAFGFDRGFDHYEKIRHELTYADRVVDGAMTFLRQRDPRPLFLFLHFMDAHSDFMVMDDNKLPYHCPVERQGRLPFPVSPGGDEFCRGPEECATAYLQSLDRDRVVVPDGELRQLRALYDCGIETMDADLARLFRELRRSGRYEEAMIVVVSDHGEEFREHGRFLHDQVYDESLHVPLLVKLPGNRRAGTRVADLVDLADLRPTLLDAAGIGARERPGEAVRGHSLIRRVDCAAAPDETAMGEPCPPPRRALLLQDKRRRHRWALRTLRSKLILNEKTGATELYELRSDPGELDDLAAARPGKVERLEKALRHLLAEDRSLGRRLRTGAEPGAETGGSRLSEEQRRRLQALGYLN